MAASSWKTLSLFGVMLLIALGLQVGSIKTMITLNSPDPPDVADARPTPPARVEPSPAKPAELVADPPHLATPHSPTVPSSEAASPEAALPAHGAVSPEAALPAHGAVSPEAAVPAHGAVSPEAATASAHNPMVSNIPPPIELSPEPSEPSEPPKPAVATTSPEALAEAASAAATPPTESPASTTVLQEPEWLKSRDANRYTVQLYSGKDMAKLREIAGSMTKGAAPPAYFVTTSRSGPWYSLVVGDYPDFTAAQTVATQIAAQSPTMKPWIRRFSEIQARMR
ncbi:MAG TPA: hypothetical protein DCS21_09690 [Gammaproteobacteria bacterium]|nr:hypothetical protein [Gammaproteobacteria bacterium]